LKVRFVVELKNSPRQDERPWQQRSAGDRKKQGMDEESIGFPTFWIAK